MELEKSSLDSAAIANVGILIAKVNGEKRATSHWFNLPEVVLFRKEAVEKIPPKYAASFMRLHNARKVPEWVLDHIDVEMMKASAGTLEDAE